MKKILAMMLIILCAFLVACSQTKYVCDDGTAVDNPAQCDQEQTQEAKEDNVEPVQESRDETEEESDEVQEEVEGASQVHEVFAKSQKLESISYSFREKDTKTDKVKVYVKNDMVKIELALDTGGVLNVDEEDTIIFDTTTRKATSYCESVKYCIKTGEITTIDYDDNYLETPFDWIEKAQGAQVVGTGSRIGDRPATKVEMSNGDVYWVDSFFGVPLKVKTQDSEYSFDDMEFNKVSDAKIGFLERE